MVPASDDHKDTPEVDSSASTKEHKSGRLTPMPDYLMHWLTPVLFAIILLAAGCFLASIWRMPLRPVSWQTINPFWPPSWPFNYHWPSKDAMALCATIAGAGFAFSTWQQRSHDNAVREQDKLHQEQAESRAREDREKQRDLDETRRLEQIERDEYWKRREQIYQLLGSENPGLRLGAVALLAELADSAAHSTHLNETEKQHLQRHIIDTLCLQVRHEGQAANASKNSNEHSKIQQLIIETILERANVNKMNNFLANWSHHKIDLSDSNIITSVYISDFTTLSLINFNGSHFFKPVTIHRSTIYRLLWQTATFDSFLTVGDFEHPTKFGTDGFPHRIDRANIHNTTIITSRAYAIYRSPSTNTAMSGLELKSCIFLEEDCKCPTSCYCKCKGDTCLCNIHLECKCEKQCFTYGEIDIEDDTSSPSSTKQNPTLDILGCTMARIYIPFNNSSSDIILSRNSIEDEIYIFLSGQLEENQIPQLSEDKSNYPKNQITLHKNTSFEGNNPASVDIHATNGTLVSEYVTIIQEN